MTSPFEISRVFRSKQQASAAYNRLSCWYDWLSASSEQPLAELGLHKLDVCASETLLDVGCGTGPALLTLAQEMGETGRVFGVDLSSGMLKVASEKLARANLSRPVNLNQGDAAALPYKSDSFDAVFSSFTLELFDTPEIATVLAECCRVLKPAGRIGVVALARDEIENLPTRIYEWFHQRLPAYVDCRPIFVQSALRQAGFQLQDVTRKMMWGLPVEICLAQKHHSQGPG
jgi:ubiquinone/menaquinone biosynthesis C-methylase UbiE